MFGVRDCVISTPEEVDFHPLPSFLRRLLNPEDLTCYFQAGTPHERDREEAHRHPIVQSLVLHLSLGRAALADVG